MNTLPEPDGAVAVVVVVVVGPVDAAAGPLTPSTQAEATTAPACTARTRNAHLRRIPQPLLET